MLCPNNANRDFDDLLCRDCEWYMQCFKMWQNGNIWNKKDDPTGDNFPEMNHGLPSFIENGICEKDNITICNLGYACDACPYNKKELNNQEQEILSSIRMIGDGSTWEMVEAIKDARLRLRYRLIFIKLGGKIPEKEI